jgi:AcrR family transcriptional regulator
LIATPSTRDKILDAAELEFSKRGYDSCSLRIISDLYNINLGLIHYYFGGKEGLFSAVFLRRSKDLVERREALLSAALQRSSGEPLAVSEIVDSFIAPTVEMMKESEGTKAYIRLQGLLRVDMSSFARKLRGEAFNATNIRFVRELQRSCPHLTPASVFWRFSAMVGAFYGLVSQSARAGELSGGLADSDDIDAAYREVVPFIVGGFSLPESKLAHARGNPSRRNSAPRRRAPAKK